jgi:hypothetical protein
MLTFSIFFLFTGLQDYLIKQQNYLSQKETDFKATSESLKQCIKRIDELQDSIVLFESDCRNKGIDPKDCSNHAEEFVLALQGKKKIIFQNEVSINQMVLKLFWILFKKSTAVYFFDKISEFC